MSEQHDERSQIYSFRCDRDCIHVVCYNVTLTLKHPDFLKLTEVLNSLQMEMEEDGLEAAGVNPPPSDALLM